MAATQFIPQKTAAEVLIYPHNLDPIAFKPKGEHGESTAGDPHGVGRTLAQLIAVDTDKTIGGVGTWSATVKVPRSRLREFEASFTDGDWVDVLLQRDTKHFHVMRGVVDAVDPLGQVGAGGADTLAFQISGFDHQQVFERTEIWFNTFSEENLVGGAAMRASTLVGRLFGLGGVRETVAGLLYGFIQELNTHGRGLWELPSQMYGGGGEPFAQACARLFDSRVDDPARIATGINLLGFEQSTVWALAREWCEPQLNELWCDLARADARRIPAAADLADGIAQSEQYEPYVLRDSDALGPTDTQMAVFLRRRPFPTAEGADGISTGPWSKLPTATIQPQELEVEPIHRSGAERFNIFEVYPSTVQEVVAQSLALLAPLVDEDDVRKRGARPMSMRSRFHANIPKGVSDEALAESQRRMLRDWHCLNPHLYNGRLQLRTFRPGIRVGTVACVTGNPERLRGREAEDDLTTYVERVRNSWRAPNKGTTELHVTRGYRGGDDALYDALDKARARFRLLQPSRAARGSGT